MSKRHSRQDGRKRAANVGLAVLAVVVAALVVVAMRSAASGTPTTVLRIPTASGTTTVSNPILRAPVAPASALLFENFAIAQPGQPSHASTGQQWSWTGANPLRISEGAMRIKGAGAGYTAANIGRKPRQVGGSVTFDQGNKGGVAVLIVSKGPGLDLDNMAVHYYFDPSGWMLEVREHGELPFPVLASGQFSDQLKQDGKTVYTVVIDIDGANVVIHQPDGQLSSVSDPRVAANTSGNVAWEIYRTANDQTIPAFTKVWAH